MAPREARTLRFGGEPAAATVATLGAFRGAVPSGAGTGIGAGTGTATEADA